MAGIYDGLREAEEQAWREEQGIRGVDALQELGQMSLRGPVRMR